MSLRNKTSKRKYKSNRVSKKKYRSNRVSKRKSKTQKAGGEKKTYKIFIGLPNLKSKKKQLSCNICDGKIFVNRRSKLDTGSSAKEFVFGEFGELFGSKTELFKCTICGHIMWFKKGIEFEKK